MIAEGEEGEERQLIDLLALPQIKRNFMAEGTKILLK